MEHWKDIPGYEGLYQASDTGRIRTSKDKVTSNARFSERHWKQRILKTKRQRRKNGHASDERVSLWKNGSEKTLLVSRLVARTWCDGYENGYTVNHIDGNPENNKAENLEWVTLKENIQMGFADSLYHTQKKTVILGKDGVVREFVSMSKASQYLGKNSGYINMVLSKGKRVTNDGVVILRP